jgi:hypothetical protein
MAKASKRASKRTITERQATRLASVAGIEVDKLSGRTIGEINDLLIDRIRPELLWYREICGTVVKRDPLTGELRPVPGATVEVQDTDCSFLTYYPGGGLMWLFPGLCTRETIATVTTDECGNFCLLVPRWEIDRILTWRKERICFPFERPRIIDVIDPPRPPVDRAWIDPGWIDPVPELRLREQLTERLGPTAADRILLSRPRGALGDSKATYERVLNEPLPRIAPPRPSASPKDIVDLTPDPLGPIDWDRWVGPFQICRDVYVPHWTWQIDVPDITFRVTQEIAGSEVVIYSEGLFDVRWNDTGSGDVIIEASQAALAVDVCDGPEVECGTTPAITAASLMPLVDGYHGADGYGQRVNRPSTDGVTPPPALPTIANAESPIADRLDLFGCAHMTGATHYRLVAQFEGGPSQPLTGFSWPARRASDGAIVTIAPDADGWIAIQDLMAPWDHLLTAWPTQRSEFGNGIYELRVETGAPGGSSNQFSAPKTFEVDNTYPHWDRFDVEYRVGGAAWTALDLADCPRIARGPGQSIDLRLTWQASADHLRSASVGFGGCSESSQPALSPSVAAVAWWWRDTPPAKTTTGTRVAEWTIDPTDAAGCYTLSGVAVGRAYNPAVPGLDLSTDYFGLEDRRRVHKRESISIVDAAP